MVAARAVGPDDRSARHGGARDQRSSRPRGGARRRTPRRPRGIASPGDAHRAGDSAPAAERDRLGRSLFLLGLVYGAIAQEAGTLYEDVERIEDYLERIGAAAAVDQFLALSVSISSSIAVGFAIQSALRLRSEEATQRAESVLATSVARVRWLGSHVGIALSGSAAMLFAIGLGFGIGRWISAGDAGELPRLIGAAIAYAPALWVFVGLAVALFGIAPRIAGLTWGLFGGIACVTVIGPLLRLPDWLFDLSPLEHVPRLPVAEFSVVPELGLTLVAATLSAIGVAAFQRRDLTTT